MWDQGVTISPLKPLTSSSGLRHAVFQYHMTLLSGSDNICNDPEKTLATPALSLQND